MSAERRRGENGWWVLSLGYWHTDCNRCGQKPMYAKEMTELYEGMFCGGCTAWLVLPPPVPVPLMPVVDGKGGLGAKPPTTHDGN